MFVFLSMAAAVIVLAALGAAIVAYHFGFLDPGWFSPARVSMTVSNVGILLGLVAATLAYAVASAAFSPEPLPRVALSTPQLGVVRGPLIAHDDGL